MKYRNTLSMLLVIAVLCLSASVYAKELRIALVVKNLGNGFFEASNRGAQEAAAEIGGVDVIYTGPTTPTAEGQIEIIRSLIAQKVNGVIISANDPDSLVTITRRALKRGIPVMSFDSGIAEKGRIVHLAPSDAKLIGYQQVELRGPGAAAQVSGAERH